MNKTEFHAEIDRITARASEEIGAALKRVLLASIEMSLFGSGTPFVPDVVRASHTVAAKKTGKKPGKKSKKPRTIPTGHARVMPAKKPEGRSKTVSAEENRAKVMEFVHKNPGTDGASVQKACNLSKEDWRYARETLNDQGKLRIEGERRDARYFVV